MKRSKFSETQIAFALRQAEDGTVVGEVCQKAGISDATLSAWREGIRRLDAVGNAAAERDIQEMPSASLRRRRVEVCLQRAAGGHPSDVPHVPGDRGLP